MFHYSSLKYDTIKTIILKDVYNTEENSMLEHKSAFINDVYNEAHFYEYFKRHQKCKKSHKSTQKSSKIHIFQLWPKNQEILAPLHSIKQIWSKSDNKKWSKLYKMWVTLLQSRSYRLFKVYFKSAKKHGHQ